MSDLSYEQSLILKNCARENPTAHSHTEIKEIFDAMDPMNATYARDDYAAIATAWEETVTVFAARIRRSSESAWSGPAAETSRQAIGDYATDATNLTPALWGLAYRVDNMVSAVLTTKNGMPPVVHDPQSILSPGDWFDGDGGVSEAEQGAQQHMATNYVTPAVSADGQVPVLPLPRSPVAVNDGGVPNTTDTGDPGTSPAGDPTESETPGQDTPGEEQPGEQQPTGEEPTSEDSPSESTESEDGTPESTMPSTTGDPAVTPASTTTGTPPGVPGNPSGPGGPGSPAGAPGSAAPAPGQTLPGSPVPAGAATTAAARAAAGAPGTRAGMPMMGAAGAGRGGGGDDDRDRQTPDYLITEENTRELLGEEPRTIPGGVLGADVPAAGPSEPPPRI
ncbi:WXG100 family type VII secretion target [Nocardia sp. NPDC003345]